MSDNDLMRRATAAYFRTGTGTGTEQLLQPSTALSGVEDVKGLTYAVLRNANGLLAVYRLTNQGQLRRLRRWPKDLEK